MILLVSWEKFGNEGVEGNAPPADNDDSSIDDNKDSSEDDPDITENAAEDLKRNLEQDDAVHCEWEDKMMLKDRTVCAFRNELKFDTAYDSKKLFPAIVAIDELDDGRRQVHQVCVVMRLPKKRFGWRKVNFDDDEGCHFNGLCFAPITLGPVTTEDCPQSIHEVQKRAQMAAVLIPLHYVLGADHEDALKHCVITNFWKERQHDGNCTLPGLDFTLYE